MTYFKINNTDLSQHVKSMKIGYETLVSDNSGRNANGDTVIDVINKKAKIYITFIPMFKEDMERLLATIEDYVVNVSYLDAKTNTIKSINCYCGTPEPEFYFIHGDKVLYKELSINFIEL